MNEERTEQIAASQKSPEEAIKSLDMRLARREHNMETLARVMQWVYFLLEFSAAGFSVLSLGYIWKMVSK